MLNVFALFSILSTILRVKEWEREKRLKERAKRKACREKMEAMSE